MNELDVMIEDSSLSNALRRIMISRIKTVAIDTVTIKENDTIYSDEIIAHRLGQIPLINKSDETCISFELNKKGPCKIYSKDLIFNNSIIPVSDNILIIELKNDEKLELFGNTEEGTAHGPNGHSKWSVSSGITHKKINDDKFLLHIETTGTFTAKETLNKAIEILRQDIIFYKKLLL